MTRKIYALWVSVFWINAWLIMEHFHFTPQIYLNLASMLMIFDYRLSAWFYFVRNWWNKLYTIGNSILVIPLVSYAARLIPSVLDIQHIFPKWEVKNLLLHNIDPQFTLFIECLSKYLVLEVKWEYHKGASPWEVDYWGHEKV